MKEIKSFLILITMFIASSCGQEIFSPNRSQTNFNSNPIQNQTISSCSNFTYIRPEVDFLFLWDNSSSTTFITPQTKAALNNTIDLISNRFDYHIMMAPLIQVGNNNAVFMSMTNDGLNSQALSMKVDRSLAAQKLDEIGAAPQQQYDGSFGGSKESGVTRAVELVGLNDSNGIFRQNAYTIIVVMSNQDDNSWVQGAFPTQVDKQNYINQKFQELMCLRGDYSGCFGSSLNSLQMRFISIAPHQVCGPGTVPNDVYKQMSQMVYNATYSNPNQQPNDQNIRIQNGETPDAYDLCDQSDYTRIFDGINNSITDAILEHRYNYWPVASAGASAINPNEIIVQKDGVSIPRLNEPVTDPNANGFTFTNQIQTVNTRFEPTPGEPFSGYVVKLYGDAIVTYPECMTVRTQSAVEYFGYAWLDQRPLESSIELKINGNVIPQSSTNGWELMKTNGQPTYYSNFNIKIVGPGDYTPATPALQYSGYFLRLNGNAIYSNGADVDVTFLPSGN